METSEEAKEIKIPFDVVAEFILPYIPTRNLVRLRLVCKAWDQLINDPDFIRRHLSCHNPTLHWTPPPLFTTTKNGSTHHHGHQFCGFIQSFNPIDRLPKPPPNFYVMDIQLDHINGHIKNHSKPTKVLNLENCPKSHWVQMLAPCKGLVMLVEGGASPYICNPVTGESVTLPRPGWAGVRELSTIYGFGFDDRSKQFKVVRVWKKLNALGDSYSAEHAILSLGKDSSWRQLGPLPSGYHSHRLHSYSILYHSSVHWLACAGYGYSNPILVAFDFRNEEFKRKALPPGALNGAVLSNDVDGRLALVAEEDGGFDVWVLGDYESDIWTRTHHVSLKASCHELFVPPGQLHKYVWFWPLIISEDEILLQWNIRQTLRTILYHSKLKVIQDFELQMDREINYFHTKPEWYIYKQDPGSALFMSALRGWYKESFPLGKEGQSVPLCEG